MKPFLSSSSSLLLLCFISAVQGQAINLNNPLECSANPQPISLNPGDIFPVQSPNFPKTLTTLNSTDIVYCGFNFTVNDQSGTQLYFIFTNGITYGLQCLREGLILKMTSIFLPRQSTGLVILPQSAYDSNYRISWFRVKNTLLSSPVQFEYDTTASRHSWSAYQGVVYVQKNGSQSNCLFSGQSFNLDQTQFAIPIYGLSNEFPAAETCSWTFAVAPGHSLKVKTLSLDSGMPGPVIMDTDSHVNTNIVGTGAIYVKGSHFVVTYSKPANNNATILSGFAALVSIVPDVNAGKNTACQMRNSTMSPQNSPNFVITNFDVDKGYESGSSCSQTVKFIENNIARLTLSQSAYEYQGDFLQLRGNSFMYNLGPGEEVNVDVGVEFDVHFISDGSIIEAGFEIDVDYVSCTCPPAKITIPCNSTVYQQLSPTSNSYCSNMNCTFSFVMDSTCLGQQIEVEPFVSLREKAVDLFTLTANGSQVWLLSSVTNNSLSTQTFKPYTHLEGVFVSGASSVNIYETPYFTLSVTSSDPPKTGSASIPSISIFNLFVLFVITVTARM